MPRYLQLMALLAYHTFIRENVNAVICETHHGGEYDSTNFIQNPIVTAVTTIGMDHVAQLGPNIENIAWHKAGIFKSSAKAFSAPQNDSVMKVLKDRAKEKDTEVAFLDEDANVGARLSDHADCLATPVQLLNCTLAEMVVSNFLDKTQNGANARLSRDDIAVGVRTFHWPGRFQVIEEGRNKWFLDGAHNELSLVEAAKWFAKSSAKHATCGFVPKILIFTHLSDSRDGLAMLETLAKTLKDLVILPNHIIFTTYYEKHVDENACKCKLQLHDQYSDSLRIIDEEGITVRKAFGEFSRVLKVIQPDAEIAWKETINDALLHARMIGEQHEGMQTLITGSLHLVGGALNILQPIES
jgi:folylpolyglutamate synthase